MEQQAISLDTTVQLAKISRRTLWRRLNDGLIGRCGTDARGRALLALADVVPLLSIQLEKSGDMDLLIAADQGDSAAQNEMGILCLEQEQLHIARYWFELAAEGGHADAMHYLSRLYLGELGHSGGGGGWLRLWKIVTRPFFGCPRQRCMVM